MKIKDLVIMKKIKEIKSLRQKLKELKKIDYVEYKKVIKVIRKRIIGWSIVSIIIMVLALIIPSLVFGLKDALIIVGIAIIIVLLFEYGKNLINTEYK
jgi:predicted membrane chloride channel (bestrophin family)